MLNSHWITYGVRLSWTTARYCAATRHGPDQPVQEALARHSAHGSLMLAVRTSILGMYRSRPARLRDRSKVGFPISCTKKTLPPARTVQRFVGLYERPRRGARLLLSGFTRPRPMY